MSNGTKREHTPTYTDYLSVRDECASLGFKLRGMMRKCEGCERSDLVQALALVTQAYSKIESAQTQS